MHPFFLCIIVVFEPLSHISPCLFTTQGQTVHKLQIAIFWIYVYVSQWPALKYDLFQQTLNQIFIFDYVLQIQSEMNSIHPFFDTQHLICEIIR